MPQVIRIPKPEAVTHTVNQTAHGFTLLNAIGFDGTASPPLWRLAQADTFSNLKLGMVTSVTSVDDFELTLYGMVTITGHGLTVGATYYLDDTTPGMSTDVAPSDPDTYQHAVFEVIDEDRIKVLDQGAFLNQPGGPGPTPPYP